MAFTPSMYKRILLVTLCAVGALSGARPAYAWELPGRPTHPDQCQPNQWGHTPDWRQWMNQREQITIELRRRPSCDKLHNAPSTAWTHCMNEGMRIADELYRRHDAIKEQATREYAAAQRQCEAVARQNQSLIKQQEESQQRAQQQRAMSEENQRRMQQEQTAQDQQRRQQQALLEQQQREASLADQQRRQQLGNQQQQQTLLDQRQRDAALSEQQRRQQQAKQQLTLLEQKLEEFERQRRLQAGTQERQPQQQLQPQRQQPAPALASVVPRSPSADNASQSQVILTSIEKAAASYEAAMQRTVQVGDTALSVGGLKDTLVGLATNFLSSIKSTSLLRGIGRGAGSALVNPVLEIAGPFLDPENGKNIYTTVEAVRRGGQGNSWNENATRIFRELEEAERGTVPSAPNVPATTDARRSWYRD